MAQEGDDLNKPQETQTGQAPVPSVPPPPPQPETPEELRRRLAETEKRLSEEKEKVLMADVRSKQEEAFAAHVEASLKDIQQKMQRDKREKEIEEERAQLREKVRELDNRLIAERESWVQILRTQLQQAPQQKQDAPSPVETAILTRLESLEQKWGGAEKPQPAQPQAPAPDRIDRLENELLRAAREKEAVTNELNRIKETFSKLERQSVFLEQISSVVVNLRDTVDRMSRQQSPFTLPLSPQPPQFPAQMQAAPQSYAEQKLKEQLAAADQTAQQQDAVLAKAEQDKLRAINGLMRLKRGLMRMKAVNVALERELRALHEEKTKSDALAQANAEQADKLRSTLETKQTEIVDLSKAVEEQHSRATTLETELSRIRTDHQTKTAELTQMLSSQSEEFTKRIEELEGLSTSTKEELVKSQAAGAELQQKLEELERAKDAAQAQHILQLQNEASAKKALEAGLAQANAEMAQTQDNLRKTETEKKSAQMENLRLSAEQKRLGDALTKSQSEQAALAFKIFKAENETKNIAKQKQLLDLMLTQMRAKSEKDQGQIQELQTRYSDVETRYSKLQATLSLELEKAARTESELKDLLAQETAVSSELKTRLERYEGMAKSMLQRVRWTLSGKISK
jgi:chromosome segregation ATPase